MAQTKEVVSGVGARFAAIFNLNSNGLPIPQVPSAVPLQGSLIQGIKTLAVTDPDPQLITHYGDDRPFAQDKLPATEVGSFVVTTAKTNHIIDTMMEGTKIRAQGSNIQAKGGNTNQRGNEPQVMAWFFRQALDTKKSSTTFGKLRQWQMRCYPSVRFSPVTESFEQTNTDKSYNGAPSPVTVTPFNEQFTDANWGFTEAEYYEDITNYRPIPNFWLGTPTITAFQLSHPPVSSADLTVWVNGTVTSPTAVNTSAANPAFTLASVADGATIGAIIETNAAI